MKTEMNCLPNRDEIVDRFSSYNLSTHFELEIGLGVKHEHLMEIKF